MKIGNKIQTWINKFVKFFFKDGSFYLINDNEKSENRHGTFLKKFRVFLYFTYKKSFTVEWVAFSKSCHANIDIGGDHDILFSIAIPFLFSVYFSTNGFMKYTDDEKSTGVSIHNWAIYFEIWNNPYDWNRNDPKWKSFNFGRDNILDFFLGKEKYSSRTLEKFVVDVPMPEGNYKGVYRKNEYVHKRPKWKPRVFITAEVEVKKGVPVPGKGENSWDCGENAILSVSTSSFSPHAAVSEFVENVLSERYRHGGKKWRPERIKQKNGNS